MKRYLVFGITAYYPNGGWGDFVSSHVTLDEALAAARAWKELIKSENAWADIIDLQTEEEITPEEYNQ